jgi:hemolysin III
MQDTAAHREELASTITHGIGALASLGGGAFLVGLAVLLGDGWEIFGAAVFATSLVLLYSASTLFHGVRDRVAKSRLRVLDHCAIFVLIAGTYTPFTLGSLRGVWGWAMFAAVWTLAAGGIVFKLFHTGRYPRLSTLLYLAMGWLVVIAAGPLLRALPASVLLWLLAGGLSYTGGTLVYHSRRIPYAHAWWHLFVLAGSACHFVAVLQQLLLARPA